MLNNLTYPTAFGEIRPFLKGISKLNEEEEEEKKTDFHVGVSVYVCVKWWNSNVETFSFWSPSVSSHMLLSRSTAHQNVYFLFKLGTHVHIREHNISLSLSCQNIVFFFLKRWQPLKIYRMKILRYSNWIYINFGWSFQKMPEPKTSNMIFINFAFFFSSFPCFHTKYRKNIAFFLTLRVASPCHHPLLPYIQFWQYCFVFSF